MIDHLGGVASTWNNFLLSNDGENYSYQLSSDSSIASLDFTNEFIDLPDSYYKSVVINETRTQFYSHSEFPVDYNNVLEFEIFNSHGDLVESIDLAISDYKSKSWRWLGYILRNVAEQVDYLDSEGGGSIVNNFLVSNDGNSYSYNINIANTNINIDPSEYTHIYNINLLDLSSVDSESLLKIDLSYGDGSEAELFYSPSIEDLANEALFKENLLKFIVKYQQNIVYVNNDLYTNISNQLYSKDSLTLSLDLESQVNLHELENEYSSLVQKDDRFTFVSHRALEEAYRVELELSSESLDEPLSFTREIDDYNKEGWRWFSYFAGDIANALPEYFTAHNLGSTYRTYLENHTQEQFDISYKIYDANGDLIAGNGVNYDLEEQENTLFDIRNRELNYELDASSIIAEYEVNEVNQYTIINFIEGEEVSLTYDNAGNLTFDGNNDYDWDARNRLSSAETVDDLTKWEYTYDSQNRRVATETFTRENIDQDFISEDLTKFIYNNYLLIAEINADGSVTREYFYSDDANGDAGVGKLIGFTDYSDETGGLLSAESETYFVISDNVGNITSVINTNGETVNTYAYSPFGELIVEQEQVALNIGFNTKYEDESGLTYYNNRYYDSDLGRFISQDPIFEDGGVNLYNFVENDPVNNWDILGLYNLQYDTFDYFSSAETNLIETTFTYVKNKVQGFIDMQGAINTYLDEQIEMRQDQIEDYPCMSSDDITILQDQINNLNQVHIEFNNNLIPMFNNIVLGINGNENLEVEESTPYSFPFVLNVDDWAVINPNIGDPVLTLNTNGSFNYANALTNNANLTGFRSTIFHELTHLEGDTVDDDGVSLFTNAHTLDNLFGTQSLQSLINDRIAQINQNWNVDIPSPGMYQILTSFATGVPYGNTYVSSTVFSHSDQARNYYDVSYSQNYHTDNIYTEYDGCDVVGTNMTTMFSYSLVVNTIEESFYKTSDPNMPLPILSL